MAKVRTINAFCGNGVDRHSVEVFVYRGYYAIKGHKSAFHTDRYLRNNFVLGSVKDNDVFTMDHTNFDTADYFKEVVDEHIEYLLRAFGTLEKYFALN